MTPPVPPPGPDRLPPCAVRVRRSGLRARGWPLLAAGLLIGATTTAGAEATSGAASRESPPRTRSFSETEIQAWWTSGPPRSEAHRGYIFIDEDEIIEAFELPVFRIEAARGMARDRIARMLEGDEAVRARAVDLAPSLARETEWRRRAESAFYSRRPGRGSDVPQTPDVLVGPLTQLLARGR